MTNPRSEARADINYRAWATNMIAFIREHDLEIQFKDWSGGWPCPVNGAIAGCPTCGGASPDGLDCLKCARWWAANPPPPEAAFAEPAAAMPGLPSRDEIALALINESRRFSGRALVDRLTDLPEHHYRDQLRYADAILKLTPSQSGETREVERWRHAKRGTVYEVIGRGELQMSFDALVDGSSMVVYRGDDGKIWVREEGEFEDGRFERLKTSPDDGGLS